MGEEGDKRAEEGSERAETKGLSLLQFRTG